VNDHRVLPRFRSEADEETRQKRIAAIVLESGEPAPIRRPTDATTPGDQRQLRGIPVVGRGVGGTSPGSDPLAEILRDRR
jgi:hypothetical protein